jgi:hypothetical protein
MPRPKHYFPTLDRFLISVLYHEAQKRKQPMTKVANSLLKIALDDIPSWHQAESALVLKEEPLPPVNR